MKSRHACKVGKLGIIRSGHGINSDKTRAKPDFKPSLSRLYAIFIRYITIYSDFLIKGKKIKNHFGGM